MKINLSLTEDCNFNCSYCYMNLQKGTRLDLSPENIIELKKSFDLVYDTYKEIKLILLGGEPLLYWDDIIKIAEISNEHPFKFKGIITNGFLLTEDKKQFLTDNNIRVLWSFDGLWTQSDKLDYFIKNKDLFSSFSFCKCVIDKENLNDITRNFSYLIDEFNITSPEMFLTKNDIFDEKDIEILDKELYNFSEEYQKRLDKNNTINCSLYDTIIEKYITKCPNTESCTTKKESDHLAFCTDGNIYPCIRFFHKDICKLGNWKKGFLDFNVINNLKDEEIITNCDNCYVKNICPKQCLENVINNNNKLNENTCKIYKVLIKHALNFYKNNKKLFNERYNT